MKISILWGGLASYSVAFYRELAESQNCRIQLVYQPSSASAPYRRFDLSFCESSVMDTPETRRRIDSLVTEFAPDCILMASWNYPHFMRIAKRLKKSGTFVLAGMDNQWRGSAKQWLGVLTAKWNLKPAITTFFVAGDRQAAFAQRLGYEDVLYGLYAADIDRFESGPSIAERPRTFLFVGRLAKEKGIADLIEGYARYRKQCADPWDLTIAGTGPLLHQLEGVPGVKCLGFVEPDGVPALFNQASCFVLPSIWEPWGVVLHEAAAAGLPIICTYRCGASTAFVRDGLNGVLTPPNASALAAAFIELSSTTERELQKMSSYSRVLARLWTPALAAEYVAKSVTARLNNTVPR